MHAIYCDIGRKSNHIPSEEQVLHLARNIHTDLKSKFLEKPKT
jgi:hypothetical protein